MSSARLALHFHDRYQVGRELLEGDDEPDPVEVAHLELVAILKDEEHFVVGNEMTRRSREELRANHGLRQAEHMLAHEEHIPTEFREYFLVFPRTVWRIYGELFVPCLCWHRMRWTPSSTNLHSCFYDDTRLVRRRTSA